MSNFTPTPTPIGWTHLVGGHRRRDFFSLSAGGAIAFGETVAFLSSVIPAEAGIQRPKTRHSPLDSRLRGNDGNREVGEPKCDCPGQSWRPCRLKAPVLSPPAHQ